MSSSNSISKTCSNSKNVQQYIVSTTNSNLNQTTGRVIIAKAHPPTLNSDSNNHFRGPIQFQFNSTDGTLYPGNNSFFQSQSNNISSDLYSSNIYSSNGSYFQNSCQPLTHTTRASPSTVEWLVENFEPGEGCSLRRSSLYSYYLQHCSQQKLESVNPASFGKLIRSVFLGLKTRRLGTRGNSKYHYYGIRIKQNSPLNNSLDEQTNNHFYQFKNSKSQFSNDEDSSPENENNSSIYQSDLSQTDSKTFLQQNNSFIINQTIFIDPSIQINIQQLIQLFENSYKDHCQKLFDLMTRLDFDSVEEIYLNYWSSKEFSSIYSLNSVENFVMNCDYELYEQVVKKLIPDILSPITGNITQSIRTFGKNIGIYLKKSLNDVPERIREIKLRIVNGFSMQLRRYTSLNHLSQSARSVLLNSTQVKQMFEDLNKVDFRNIQEQGWWICECDENFVLKIEKEFKNNLSNEFKLEEWCQWIDFVLNDLFKSYIYLSEEKLIKRGKQILLNWSYYSSMIIRDLTLRSASSFGSFHLIRLLFDEYLYYLIEHKLAEYIQTTSIAVTTQLKIENALSTKDCLNPSNNCDEQRNIPSKISVLLKKDSLSQGKILTFPSVNVQLPIFNKLISQLNQTDPNNSDSVKRFKTNEQTISV